MVHLLLRPSLPLQQRWLLQTNVSIRFLKNIQKKGDRVVGPALKTLGERYYSFLIFI